MFLCCSFMPSMGRASSADQTVFRNCIPIYIWTSLANCIRKLRLVFPTMYIGQNPNLVTVLLTGDLFLIKRPA